MCKTGQVHSFSPSNFTISFRLLGQLLCFQFPLGLLVRLGKSLCFQFPLGLLVIFGSVNAVLRGQISMVQRESWDHVGDLPGRG